LDTKTFSLFFCNVGYVMLIALQNSQNLFVIIAILRFCM